MDSERGSKPPPLNLMLCPPPFATCLPTLPRYQARHFPAQLSCVVWPEPRDKSRLQSEFPSLPLSRQVQEELGGERHAEEAFGCWPGRSPSLDRGLKQGLGL